MQMISGSDPIFEPKPLTTIHFEEESLEVDLIASEDNLIKDLFQRFSTNKGDSNSNSTNTISDSSDAPPSRSEIEIHNVNLDCT